MARKTIETTTTTINFTLIKHSHVNVIHLSCRSASYPCGTHIPLLCQFFVNNHPISNGCGTPVHRFIQFLFCSPCLCHRQILTDSKFHYIIIYIYKWFKIKMSKWNERHTNKLKWIFSEIPAFVNMLWTIIDFQSRFFFRLFYNIMGWQKFYNIIFFIYICFQRNSCFLFFYQILGLNSPKKYHLIQIKKDLRIDAHHWTI